MIDVDEIYRRAKDAVALAVGDSLTQIPVGPGGADGTAPSIWSSTEHDRSGGVRPFALVDIPSRVKNGAWSTERYYNEDGDVVTTIAYDYLINFGIYGGNALEIAGELESSFVRDDVQAIFTHDNFAGIVETFPAATGNFREANRVLQFASFLLKITVVDTVIQTTEAINVTNYTITMDYHGQEE